MTPRPPTRDQVMDAVRELNAQAHICGSGEGGRCIVARSRLEILVEDLFHYIAALDARLLPVDDATKGD